MIHLINLSKIIQIFLLSTDDADDSWDLFIARSDRRIDILKCSETSASWHTNAHRLHALSGSNTTSEKVKSTAACYVESACAFWLGDIAGRLHAYE